MAALDVPQVTAVEAPFTAVTVPVSCAWSPTIKVEVPGLTDTAVTLGVVSGGGPDGSLPPQAARMRESARGALSACTKVSGSRQPNRVDI